MHATVINSGRATLLSTQHRTHCGVEGVNRITYWSQGVASLPHKCQPPLPSDRQHLSCDLCLEGYYQNCSVLSCPTQHTHMSSFYRSSRLGLSHWDPYAMYRGGWLELYYCNMVEWCWWDSSLIWKNNWFPSVLWHCWFGHMTCINRPRNDQ